MIGSFNARRVFLTTGTCVAFVYVLILYRLLVETETEDVAYYDQYDARDERPPLPGDSRPDWGKDNPIRYQKHSLLSAHDDSNLYDDVKRNANGDVDDVRVNVSNARKIAALRGNRLGGITTGDNGRGPHLCSGIERPHDDFEEPLLWQPVDAGHTYIFSSYLDAANNNNKSISGRILIIGISARPSKASALYCQVWYRNRQSLVAVPAEPTAVPDHHEKPFSVLFWHCPVDISLDPYAVSLVEKPCMKDPDNILLLRNVDESQGVIRPPSNFTVCVPPITHNFNDTKRFVEIMELNRMLGADRVFLYDYSSSDLLKQYLQSYILEDLATVIPWTLPPLGSASPSWSRRWRHHLGQLAAVNDCLYRSMFSCMYVVFAGLDEVIIPRALPDWRTMLTHLRKAYKDATAFSFQNIVFPLSLPDDKTIDRTAEERRYDLITQLKTRRHTEAAASATERRRSEMIVRPSEIFMVGVHGVERIRSGVTAKVSMETASVHQYRRVGDAGRPLGHNMQTDRIMHLYKNALLRTVRRRHLLVRGRTL